MQLRANMGNQMKFIKLQDCRGSRFCSTSLYFDHIDVHVHECLMCDEEANSVPLLKTTGIIVNLLKLGQALDVVLSDIYRFQSATVQGIEGVKVAASPI